MMTKRAAFVIIGAPSPPTSPLVIKDIGHRMNHFTVTNDAENVVKSLLASGRLAEGQQLFYYDSEGELGEILIKDGKFSGFAPT